MSFWGGTNTTEMFFSQKAPEKPWRAVWQGFLVLIKFHFVSESVEVSRLDVDHILEKQGDCSR